MSKTLFNARVHREAFTSFPLAKPFVHMELYPVQSPVPCAWCGRENMRYPDEVNCCRTDVCRSFVMAIELFKLGMMAAELEAIRRGMDVNETLRDYLDEMGSDLFLVYKRIVERKYHANA